MVQKFLERYGYKVLNASNPKEAIRISSEYEGQIQLLLTDVVMPGMSGKDVAKRVKSERPWIKIIYMSGYTNGFIAHHDVLDKGLEFIEKPLSLAELARKIRRVLHNTDTSLLLEKSYNRALRGA